MLKASATSLALTPHTGGVSPQGTGIRPCVATGLASVEQRRRLDPVLHDHCLAGLIAEDRCIPRPEVVPPLTLVVSVPRVGGLGTKFFRNSTWEAKPGTIPLIWCGSRVQGISETTSLWCRTSRRGQHLLASSAASGRPWPPVCRDGERAIYQNTSPTRKRSQHIT